MSADPYRWGREKLPTVVENDGSQPAVLEDTAGNEVDPATEQTLGSLDGKVATETTLTSLDATDFATEASLTSALDRAITSWTAGTLPTEQQTPVGVEDTGGTQVDPATEATLDTVETNTSGPTGLVALSHTTSSTSAEQLPAQAVHPQGEVMLHAPDGNTGDVNVGDSSAQNIPISPGADYTANVSDVSDLYVQTPNSGDAVEIHAESS